MVHLLHHSDGGREIIERYSEQSMPRAEWNARKVAELEKEWSLNGPWREITFITNFRVETGVEDFAKAARDKGFDVVSRRLNGADQHYIYTIQACRIMAPSAEEITKWEAYFIEQSKKFPDYVDEDCEELTYSGAEFERWAYPPRYRPSFYLYGGGKYATALHEKAVTARTRIIFGERVCDFEASNGWADKKGSRTTGVFQLKPTIFIENAERRRPVDPEPTASGFAQWLYSLYSNTYGNDEDRARGNAAESSILEGRRRAFASIDYGILRERFTGWRLTHSGMNIPATDRPNYFEINELSVRGQPLRVLPDLIFENKRTGAHIIVEVKHSYMTLPANLWPNIWGQLWCYSQIPAIKRVPELKVIGEVWGDSVNRRLGSHKVYLRASVRRDPRAPAYDRFFRTLFDIYRGS